MLTCSVTDLHLCQHCPRLFGYGCRGYHVGFIGHKGTGDLPGTLFHALAHTVHKDLSIQGDGRKPLISALSPDSSGKEAFFHETFKQEYFIPFLLKHASKLTNEQIEAFARACELWVSYLFDFISPHLSDIPDPYELIDSIFHTTEYCMHSDYSFPDGERMRISGRPDAILFDPKRKEPVILEYKGRKESDAPQDLAQTSLYAYLVMQSVGLTPRIEILYLEEEIPLVRYDTSVVLSLIENHPSLFSLARKVKTGERPLPRCNGRDLCFRCQFAATCERDFGAIEGSGEGEGGASDDQKVDSKSDVSRIAGQYLNSLVEKLDLLSIPVIPLGYTIGPRFIRLKIQPDLTRKVTYAKIINRAVDIQLGLSLSMLPLIQAQNGYISCDLQHENWETFDVSSLVQEGKVLPKHICPFPLGRMIDGTVMIGDLADPIMTSCLIGGTSGSGKSELIRSLIIGIVLCNPRKQISFTLIDPKRVTFTDFSSGPFLSQPVIRDPDAAREVLVSTVREMEERYVELEKRGYSSILEYNAKEPVPMGRRIIVIDEYADLIMNKTTKEVLESAIQRIGQKGRAAGFHLMLATQRPDSKIITGIIKANLQLKIALKVTSATNSRIILDESGAECLAGYGDMLIGGSIPIQRLQSARVSTRDFTACLTD